MQNAHARNGHFHKVGENLYRYSSNHRYYAVFRVKRKLIWKSLKTADRELAKRRLKEELEKFGRVDPNSADLSLKDLLKLYEQQLQKYDAKTIATRTSILNIFKRTWENGFEIQVSQITRTHLDIWLASHRQRMKKTSLNEYMRFLRQLFNIALESRAIADSPAAGLKSLKREEPIRVTPDCKQFRKIVSYIRVQRFNADAADSGDIVEFMGLAGVGLAECGSLSGEHLDFHRNLITLYRSKTDKGYTIPMFPQLKPLLRRMKAEGRIRNGQPLFRVRDPKKALSAACHRLKFPNFSTRALRRCFITRAIELGIDFKTIASWQGHKDGGVLIANTYSHLRSEHSDAMAKRLVAA